MPGYTPDALKQEVDQGRMRTGNQIQLQNGLPAVTNVSQLTADASSNLQATAHLPIVQPTATLPVFDLTGNATTGVLTQTFVGAASVTTATVAGYVRLNVTNNGSGLTSGAYYLPIYTIV